MMSDSNFSIIDMLDRDSTGKKRSDDPVPLDRLERLKQLVTDSDGKQILNSAQVSTTNLMRISSVLEWVGDEKNIVDIGGGSGFVAAAVLSERKNLRYLLTDISGSFRKPDFLPKVLKQNRTLLESGYFTTAFFDVERTDDTLVKDFRPELVLLLEVLEHVPNPETFLSSLRNHLVPGARLLISVPLFGQLELVKGHVNVFTTVQLLGIFERVGLTVLGSKGVANRWGFWNLRVRDRNEPQTPSLYRDAVRWVEQNGSEVSQALLGASLEYKAITQFSQSETERIRGRRSRVAKFVPLRPPLISQEVESGFSGLRFWVRISGLIFGGSVNLQFISEDGREVGKISWPLTHGYLQDFRIRKVLSISSAGGGRNTADLRSVLPQTARFVVSLSVLGILKSSVEHVAVQQKTNRG